MNTVVHNEHHSLNDSFSSFNVNVFNTAERQPTGESERQTRSEKALEGYRTAENGGERIVFCKLLNLATN